MADTNPARTVSNARFLHIHAYSQPEWEVGRTLRFGEKANQYWRITRRFQGFDDGTGQVLSAHRVARRLLESCQRDPDWKENRGDELLFAFEQFTHVLQQSLSQTREIIFESVRATHFPQLPSRQRCIWLIAENDPHAFEHWSRFFTSIARKHEAAARLFQVRATGTIHRANAKLLDFKANGPDEWLSLATDYWLGTHGAEAYTDEILFEGEILVEEQLELP